MIKFVDDMTFGAILNNELERSLQQKGLISRTMGIKKNIISVCAVYGGKYLKKRRHLHNKDI